MKEVRAHLLPRRRLRRMSLPSRFRVECWGEVGGERVAVRVCELWIEDVVDGEQRRALISILEG